MNGKSFHITNQAIFFITNRMRYSQFIINFYNHFLKFAHTAGSPSDLGTHSWHMTFWLPLANRVTSGTQRHRSEHRGMNTSMTQGRCRSRCDYRCAALAASAHSRDTERTTRFRRVWNVANPHTAAIATTSAPSPGGNTAIEM